MVYMDPQIFRLIVKSDAISIKADKKTVRAVRLYLTDGYSLKGASSFVEVDHNAVRRLAIRIKRFYKLAQDVAKLEQKLSI